MASKSLASMSVDALLKLKDDIGEALAARAADLRRSLARLEGTVTGKRRGRPPGATSKRRGPRKGQKAAIKYRGPEGETWTGRGIQPRWITALVKQGHRREEYAVDGAAPKKRVVRRKK